MTSAEMIVELKDATKETIKEELEGFCRRIPEFDMIIDEINEAFWDDIILEVNFRKIITDLEKSVLEVPKNNFSRYEWYDFYKKNLFNLNYRGIDRKVKVGEDESAKYYYTVKSQLKPDIWNRIYPIFLLKMHDFNLQDLEQDMAACIQKLFSYEHRMLNKMSMLIVNNIDTHHPRTLVAELKREIKHLENPYARKKKDEEPVVDYVEDDDIDYELSTEELLAIFSEDEIQKIYDEQMLVDEWEEEQYNFPSQDKDVKEILNKFAQIQVHFDSNALSAKGVPSNIEFFLKLLSYEDDRSYDKALVMKIANYLTEWIDCFIWLKKREVFGKCSGFVLDYYLASNNLSNVHKLLSISNKLKEKYFETVLKVMTLETENYEYKQIQKLIEELNGSLNGVKWGELSDRVEYLLEEIDICRNICIP